MCKRTRFDRAGSGVVDHAFDTNFGAPEAMVDSLAWEQAGKVKGAPAMKAKSTEECLQGI